SGGGSSGGASSGGAGAGKGGSPFGESARLADGHAAARATPSTKTGFKESRRAISPPGRTGFRSSASLDELSHEPGERGNPGRLDRVVQRDADPAHAPVALQAEHAALLRPFEELLLQRLVRQTKDRVHHRATAGFDRAAVKIGVLVDGGVELRGLCAVAAL